jgi:hypothetical protein
MFSTPCYVADTTTNPCVLWEKRNLSMTVAIFGDEHLHGMCSSGKNAPIERDAPPAVKSIGG